MTAAITLRACAVFRRDVSSFFAFVLHLCWFQRRVTFFVLPVMLIREQKAAKASAPQVTLLMKVTNKGDSVMQHPALAPGQRKSPSREHRPVYTAYDDVKALADFLGELKTYQLAFGGSEDFIVHIILLLALQASSMC